MSQRRPLNNPASVDDNATNEPIANSPTPTRKPDAATTPRRAYRRKEIKLMPPKLIPLDPVHEQQAISALTELLRQLLEHDRRQQHGQAPRAEHGHDQAEDDQS